MGVNITTAYLRVLIIEIGEKPFFLMVVEALGDYRIHPPKFNNGTSKMDGVSKFGISKLPKADFQVPCVCFQGTNISPKKWHFESMIFPTSPGGIC